MFRQLYHSRAPGPHTGNYCTDDWSLDQQEFLDLTYSEAKSAILWTPRVLRRPSLGSLNLSRPNTQPILKLLRDSCTEWVKR